MKRADVLLGLALVTTTVALASLCIRCGGDQFVSADADVGGDADPGVDHALQGGDDGSSTDGGVQVDGVSPSDGSMPADACDTIPGSPMACTKGADPRLSFGCMNWGSTGFYCSEPCNNGDDGVRCTTACEAGPCELYVTHTVTDASTCPLTATLGSDGTLGPFPIIITCSYVSGYTPVTQVCSHTAECLNGKPCRPVTLTKGSAKLTVGLCE